MGNWPPAEVEQSDMVAECIRSDRQNHRCHRLLLTRSCTQGHIRLSDFDLVKPVQTDVTVSQLSWHCMAGAVCACMHHTTFLHARLRASVVIRLADIVIIIKSVIGERGGQLQLSVHSQYLSVTCVQAVDYAESSAGGGSDGLVSRECCCLDLVTRFCS